MQNNFKLSWQGAIGLFILYFLLQFGLALVLYLPNTYISAISPLHKAVFSSFQSLLSDCLFIYLVFIKKGHRFSFGNPIKTEWSLLVPIAAICLLQTVFNASAISPFLANVPVSEFLHEIARQYESFPTLFIFSALVIAPVFEELIFRGIILTGLKNRYNSSVAIIISSMLFGVMHLNWHQFVYATLVGFIIGFIYDRTGKLKYAILTHFLYNFFVTNTSFAPAESTSINWVFALPTGLMIMYALYRIYDYTEESVG